MFAARANQENVIYEQQTAAAAKSLNREGKALAPKTPANKAPKTPFRPALNDENATVAAGKSGGKDQQHGVFGGGKCTKTVHNAFVTPAGLRNRAPLGNKTTNAKATAFQTPGALPQEKRSARRTSPRLRRARIKVHEAEPLTTADGEDELPEIEYMPPRGVPLPDLPEDWPHDRTYPQFEGNNLTRGWWSEFSHRKIDDDDDDAELGDFAEQLRQARVREGKDMTQRSTKKIAAPKAIGLRQTNSDPLTTRQLSALTSKDAVSALSQQSNTARTPGFAAPTVATKARLPAVPMSKKASSGSQQSTESVRYNAARLASNSTLGYSKGRAVSANSRPKQGQVLRDQVAFARNSAAAPSKTSLDDLFERTPELRIDSEDEGECFQLGFVQS